MVAVFAISAGVAIYLTRGVAVTGPALAAFAFEIKGNPSPHGIEAISSLPPGCGTVRKIELAKKNGIVLRERLKLTHADIAILE